MGASVAPSVESGVSPLIYVNMMRTPPVLLILEIACAAYLSSGKESPRPIVFRH